MQQSAPPKPLLALVIRMSCAVVLLAMASCSGESRLPVVPVKGKVMYQGKPLRDAQVVMARLAETADLSADEQKLRPHGFTNSDGEFQLTTYDLYDGAPPGRYGIGVVKQREGKSSDDKESVIPWRYANPKASGLMVVVKAPATEVPVIQIKD